MITNALSFSTSAAIIAAKFAVNMPSCKKNKVGLLFQQFSQPDNAGQWKSWALDLCVVHNFWAPSPSLHRCWKGSIFRSEPEESSQGHVASRQCLSLWKFIATECKQIWGHVNMCYVDIYVYIISYSMIVLWYYMYTFNHVLFIRKRAWHDHRMQPVFDQDLALARLLTSQCASRHLRNVSVHRSQGSDAKENDGWQFARQDTCSRTETFFKSLQFSSTSIFMLNSVKMDCCAIRRMPCPKSLISKLSYPIPSVFSPSRSHSATTIRKVCCLLQTKSGLARNSWSLNLGWKNTKNINRAL